MPSVSAFLKTPKDLKLDYSSTDFTPKYESSTVDYNKPLSVSDTSRINLFNPSDGLGNFDLRSNTGAEEVPWYKDGNSMKGYANLASAFVGLATLGPQLAAYKQNLKESKFNLNRAKVSAGKNDVMYSNLANHRFNSASKSLPAPSQTTSTFGG